jgi:hypothetical protein
MNIKSNAKSVEFPFVKNVRFQKDYSLSIISVLSVPRL